ncbi:MAG: cation diffusion facilitator family transporter [Bacteroidota bacterium]
MEAETKTLKSSCRCSHAHSDIYANKTKIVLFISVIAMLFEILFGYITNSMALLSDGWHMASHVLAIGLTWVAYLFIKKNKDNKKFKNGTDKILSLSGYSSAFLLLFVALLMIVESFHRIMHPENIHYNDALIVAILGLIINLISAKVLHHNDEHSDHNIKAVYLHVLADALTSVFAIIALFIGNAYNISWLDSITGILGSLIIIKWAIDLIIQSGKTLLDYSSQSLN